jgi:hypothetical protein
MEKKYECFKDHLNPWFVETGSYAGDGIEAALKSGFEHIISMEINETNFMECTGLFEDNSNVILFNDDSALFLLRAINMIQTRITFWLDAHFSGADGQTGLVKYPILYELAQIKQHHRKDHTIIVDDVRLWEGVSAERDFSLEDIINSLMSINPDYKITYADGTEPNDILIASL